MKLLSDSKYSARFAWVVWASMIAVVVFNIGRLRGWWA